MKKLLLLMLLASTASFGITQPHWLQIQGKPYIDARSYGAIANDGLDDRAAIQSAIEAAYADGVGVAIVGSGTYDIGRTTSGTYDRFGLNLHSSNMEIIGVNKPTLKRFDSINTGTAWTSSTGYSLIYCGVADDETTLISNIRISGVRFEGNDALHSTSGNSVPDQRTAIFISGVNGIDIEKCDFLKSDSSAIFALDTRTWINKKSYRLSVTKCRFFATAHAVAGRALIHSISFGGDGLLVDGCYFSWCDCGISTGDTTYAEDDTVETDTYSYTTSSDYGANTFTVQRTGQQARIANNLLTNSSEHAIYVGSRYTLVTNNTIYTDSPTVCISNLKLRGNNMTITGNSVKSGSSGSAMTMGLFCRNISVSGNTFTGYGTSASMVDVDATGLQTFMTDRVAWWPVPSPIMGNISITGNTLSCLDSSGSAFRIYTEASTIASLTGKHLANIAISGNNINNVKTFATITNCNLADSISIEGNNASGTAVASASVIYFTGTGGTTAGQALFIRNNFFNDFESIFRTDVAVAHSLPFLVSGNYFKDIDVVSGTNISNYPQPASIFVNNAGLNVPDRNFPVNNSIYDGSASGSYLYRNIQIVASGAATPLRYYEDDAGGYTELVP